MTRVSEAMRQAALVEEEFRLSLGLPRLTSRSVSPSSPQLLRPVDVAAAVVRYVPDAAIGADRFAAPDWQQAAAPATTVAYAPRSAPRSTPAPPSVAGKLVVSGEASRAAVEQYRRVAAALQEIQDRSRWAGHGGLERSLSVLLVTSALPGEGKTLTVINLALTLSEFYGRRVLVIDADLRGSAIHDILGLSNSVGLRDVLCSATQDLPLQEVSPLLSVLPAGRSALDPTHLASDQMRRLLRDAASSFEWVLIDAPAVGLASDARVLARLSRAVLFVIASGTTPYPVVERAMSEIGRDCIIGAVLNQVMET
jgi:protein-tyrosine kinase